MIFNLLKAKRDDATDTGTYADGAFETPVINVASTLRRVRGHIAHQRDYASDRTLASLPVGFA